jgi:hypothetical protein
LLRHADAAHGDDETNELGGVYDQEWAAWFARHVVEHGIGDLLGRVKSTEALAGELARCDEAYRRDNPAEGRPEAYARRILTPTSQRD